MRLPLPHAISSMFLLTVRVPSITCLRLVRLMLSLEAWKCYRLTSAVCTPLPLGGSITPLEAPVSCLLLLHVERRPGNLWQRKRRNGSHLALWKSCRGRRLWEAAILSVHLASEAASSNVAYRRIWRALTRDIAARKWHGKRE